MTRNSGVPEQNHSRHCAMVTIPTRAALAGCLVALAVCGAGYTQTRSTQEAAHSPPPHGADAHSLAVQPSAARLVHPDGSASSTSVKIRPDVAPIRPNDSLDQVLKRNKLSSDASTVEAIRRMNPTLNLDQLHKHAGQPMYIPKVAGSTPDRSGRVLQIQDPNLARVQLQQDRQEIVALQQKTAARKDVVFASPAVAARHQKALNDVTLASQRLEAFTPSMSVRDVALVNFQLTRVQHVAELPAFKADKGTTTVFSASQVASLERSAQPMRSVLAVTGRPGVSYEDLRREIKVVVSSTDASPPPPMRVYVLPAAVVDRPSDYPDEVLRSLLRALTFTALTTPSSEHFVFSDLAIWVGPDDAYDVMLKRLRQGQLASRPVVIREASPRAIEVNFTTP